jgi:hypothetical protein
MFHLLPQKSARLVVSQGASKVGMMDRPTSPVTIEAGLQASKQGYNIRQ